MLSTNDTGELFQAMRTAYGQQWKHGSDAMEVWRRALSRFGAKRVMQAATEVLSVYIDHPPTLPQFLAVVDNRQSRPTTYLEPPKVSAAAAMGNRALMRTVMGARGMDRDQLTLCVELKNAHIEDLGDRVADAEFGRFVEQSLKECAARSDPAARDRASEDGRQRFKRRYGLQAWA